MRKIQTLIFDKKYFDKATALEWSKEHGFKHYTSRHTPTTIRVRQFPPFNAKHILGQFNLGKHVKALYVEV